MSYTQLTEGQRYQIYALLKEGLSQKEIANNIECHPSTICRELKRNRGKKAIVTNKPAFSDAKTTNSLQSHKVNPNYDRLAFTAH